MKHACKTMEQFIVETKQLSAVETGAYGLLLAHAEEHEGTIPADRGRLARITRTRPDQWSKVWARLERYFEPASEGWRVREVERGRGVP